jgi:hypothetical protein
MVVLKRVGDGRPWTQQQYKAKKQEGGAFRRNLILGRDKATPLFGTKTITLKLAKFGRHYTGHLRSHVFFGSGEPARARKD